MFEFLPLSHDHVLAVKVDGKLTATDYERDLIPRLDRLFSRYPAINLMVVISDSFTGWSLDAAWDDLGVALKHRTGFSRLAVVGGPDWVRWGLSAGAVLMRGEMRWFAVAELDQAWHWIDVPVTPAATQTPMQADVHR